MAMTANERQYFITLMESMGFHPNFPPDVPGMVELVGTPLTIGDRQFVGSITTSLPEGWTMPDARTPSTSSPETQLSAAPQPTFEDHVVSAIRSLNRAMLLAELQGVGGTWSLARLKLIELVVDAGNLYSLVRPYSELSDRLGSGQSAPPE